MAWVLLTVVAVAMAVTTSVATAQRTCCAPGAACWPTEGEVEGLRLVLNPEMERTIYWAGSGAPYPLAFPATNPQPLFGVGVGMEPLYVQNVTAGDADCLRLETRRGRPRRTDYCKLTARNNPMNGWTPAFVAWPTTDAHVQTLVQFAAAHGLCVCVADTGHDFLNRHSCPSGLLIRTALFKDVQWDPNDDRGFGHPSGTVRFGSGIASFMRHMPRPRRTTGCWCQAGAQRSASLGGRSGAGMVPSIPSTAWAPISWWKRHW